MRRDKKRWIPLRTRLALWSAGLVLCLSFSLLLFVNIQAFFTFPTAIKKSLDACGTHEKCTLPGIILIMEGSKSTKPESLPKNAENSGEVLALTKYLTLELGAISLIGLGIVAALGGAGAYLISGLALRPLRHISETAQNISGNTLQTRLALRGPRDEVKDLADTFDAMLCRLERTFEMQNRFVADVSHELRTPLASLRTNLEIAEIVATDEQPTQDDYRALLATQERALVRLERLVSDLLILTTSEQPLKRESVSLAPLIEEALHTMQGVARQRSITLSLCCEEDVVVAGDDLLLMGVFSNLIENAICYNREGGSVTITLAQKEREALISIEDTGIGILIDQQERIFERFYRVDSSRSRHSGGAGLGLSLVLAIVRQHGGQIQVESCPGSGSTFTLCLPLDQQK